MSEENVEFGVKVKKLEALQHSCPPPRFQAAEFGVAVGELAYDHWWWVHERFYEFGLKDGLIAGKLR